MFRFLSIVMSVGVGHRLFIHMAFIAAMKHDKRLFSTGGVFSRIKKGSDYPCNRTFWITTAYDAVQINMKRDFFMLIPDPRFFQNKRGSIVSLLPSLS